MSIRALLTTCLALAVVMVAHDPLAAAPKKNQKGNNKNQPVDAAIIRQLEDVHKVLSLANPRYAGHRVKAMTSVRKAIDTLEHDKGKGTDRPLSKGDGKADESKLLSDTQVRAVAATLQGVQNEIKALPPTKYRSRAVTLLGDAMRELTLALEVAARKP